MFSSPWPGGIAFTLGPGPGSPASSVGIRLGRRAPGIVRPLYRSGFLGALRAVASGIPQLEIVAAPWHTMIESEINQSVPMMLPLTRDGVTINTASMVINEGTVTVRATGTAPALCWEPSTSRSEGHSMSNRPARCPVSATVPRMRWSLVWPLFPRLSVKAAVPAFLRPGQLPARVLCISALGRAPIGQS